MIAETIGQLSQVTLSPLDLLPHHDLREKIIALLLHGVPENIPAGAKKLLTELREKLTHTDTSGTKVVVFGGGTGLSNIIGGDSRLLSWTDYPFGGIKASFPQTSSVVCVTDDGGSTGELLKDLPIVAVGDLRHVLLSSIQTPLLETLYGVTPSEAGLVASNLAAIFNYRSTKPLSADTFLSHAIFAHLDALPFVMRQHLRRLIERLFCDQRLESCLARPHCFGNLLLAAAIYNELPEDLSNDDLTTVPEIMHQAVMTGLDSLATAIGAPPRATLPCTSSPAQLRIIYSNEIEIPGEHKLGKAQRGVPVAAVEVDFFTEVMVFQELLSDIADADIIILAPGSLYSSIIPVFKVPGLAEAVRKNQRALKILVSNLWVQTGETDLSIVDPQRKYHVSDMIRAYEKNIPGGTQDLFREVICISLQEIPASILQSYGVEGKVPIYLDREVLAQHRYIPIECGVYSVNALAERGVIQHDPDMLALAIKGLYAHHLSASESYDGSQQSARVSLPEFRPARVLQKMPFQRFSAIQKRLAEIRIETVGDGSPVDPSVLRSRIVDILWEHPVIPLSHLNYFSAIHCIDKELWRRDQQWDNVFSFFDPLDCTIKIRSDQIDIGNSLEIALMIALGESLLGNYALKKEIRKVFVDRLELGSVYHLYLCEEGELSSFFSASQLHVFLRLARMYQGSISNHYTRLINRDEGFTPPGLLMGLTYAWYIDNRFATHIEYKMSVMKIKKTDLIPEQLRMARRRQRMIQFFKNIVFAPEYR